MKKDETTQDGGLLLGAPEEPEAVVEEPVEEQPEREEPIRVDAHLESDDHLFDEVELEKVSAQIGDLLLLNWSRIQRSILQSMDLDCTVSISVKLDHSTPGKRNFDTAISYSIKMKDRASGTVSDPMANDLFKGCNVEFGSGYRMEETEGPVEGDGQGTAAPLLLSTPIPHGKYPHCGCGPDPTLCEDCYDCRPTPGETPEEFEQRTGIGQEFFPKEEEDLRSLVPEDDDRVTQGLADGEDLEIANLCDTCRDCFATCSPRRVIFAGDRYPDCSQKQKDAVVECSAYYRDEEKRPGIRPEHIGPTCQPRPAATADEAQIIMTPKGEIRERLPEPEIKKPPKPRKGRKVKEGAK